MKKILLITAFTLSTTVCASAGQQNSIGGLIIGAGSGAVMGQAIGRDTESTLIGTAVGSMVGYIIGNELDKDYQVSHHQVYHHPRSAKVHRKHVTQYNYYYEPVTNTPSPKRRCKKAEILGTVNGKAKKIYGTVCKTPQGWELVSEDIYTNESSFQRSNWKKRKNMNKRHYRNNPEKRWVTHRY